MMKKLMSNEKTKNYFTDPTYIAMLQDMQSNPNNMTKYMSDPRMMETLSVLMGIDLSKADEGSDPKAGGDASQDDNMGEPASEPVRPEAPKKEEAKQDEMEVEEEVSENVKLAENEKKLGTAAYKAKNFEQAHKHYGKAFELDPKNMVYLMNTAATYLEQKKYEKEQNFEDALTWYNRSVSEFREKTVLAKIKKLEVAKKEAAKRAYWSEEEFLKSKEAGNDAFKGGNFPDSVKHYNEAIKRKNEKDKANHDDLAIIYSNRG